MKNLKMKTNREPLIKIGLEPKVHLPNKIDEGIDKLGTKKMKLPKVMYHASMTPLTKTFNENRPFYVSFDKFQSLAHGLKAVDPFPTSKEKIYFYELTPKSEKELKVVYFDGKTRPKNLSNKLGLKYDSLNNSMLSVIDPRMLKHEHVVAKNFREGSGDNMILAYFLCRKRKDINGVRNKRDQDEFAFCKPNGMFNISKWYRINVNKLVVLKDYIQDIRFTRNERNKKYEYTTPLSNSKKKEFMHFILKSSLACELQM